MALRCVSPSPRSGVRTCPEWLQSSGCVASEFVSGSRVFGPRYSSPQPAAFRSVSPTRFESLRHASNEVASVSPRAALAATFEGLLQTARVTKSRRLCQRFARFGG